MRKYIKHIWVISNKGYKVSLIILIVSFILSIIKKDISDIFFNVFITLIVSTFIEQDYINRRVDVALKECNEKIEYRKASKRFIFECLGCKNLLNDINFTGKEIVCNKCGSKSIRALEVIEDEY